MPTQPLLDYESLIAPIPGADPAGMRDLSAARTRLDELRKEINPDAFDPEDPRRPDTAKKADWRGIITHTQEILRSTTKDYLIAARLTEALVKEKGFAGLAAGLQLLRLMTDECWDRMYPKIDEEDDIDTRARRFDWLDDVDKGAWFPSTIRLVPMMPPGPNGYGWQHWRDSQGGRGAVSPADIDTAIGMSKREDYDSLIADLEESWQELELLNQSLNQKMRTDSKNYAPSLSGIRGALSDCRMLAQQILSKKGGPVVDEAPPDPNQPVGEPDTGATSRSSTGKMETRAEIYARVAEAAARLRMIEPHSPIPYLLTRAVELGALPFPELMRQLILNGDVLQSMNRELGIKDNPESQY